MMSAPPLRQTPRRIASSAGLSFWPLHPIQPFSMKITTVDGEVRRRSTPAEMIAVRVAQLNLWRPAAVSIFPSSASPASKALHAFISPAPPSQLLARGEGRRDRPARA